MRLRWAATTKGWANMENSELIKALRICEGDNTSLDDCIMCPFGDIDGVCRYSIGAKRIVDDAADIIGKLMVRLAKKDSEIDRLSQLAMMREAELGDLERELAEKDKQLADARNELCQKCGNYKMAHFGDCDGCRWRTDNA